MSLDQLLTELRTECEWPSRRIGYDCFGRMYLTPEDPGRLGDGPCPLCFADRCGCGRPPVDARKRRRKDVNHNPPKRRRAMPRRRRRTGKARVR